MIMEKKDKKVNLKNWKRSTPIFNFLKPYKYIYGIGLICLLVSSLTAMIFPYLLGNLLGADIEQQQNEFHLTDPNNINALFLMLMILFAAQALFSFFRIYLFGVVTEKTLHDIRNTTFQKLISFPISYYDKNKVGILQSRISSDIVLLNETFNTTLAEFLRQIFTIVFGITFIGLISWKLSLIMLAIVPLIAISAVIFGKFIKKVSKRAQDAAADSNNTLLEALSGIKNVKTFVNEFFEIKKYASSILKIQNLGIKGSIWRGFFASFIILAMFGSIVFVIWNGMNMVNMGEMEEQEFFQFILYTIMIGASFGGISSLLGNIQKALGATERIVEILGLSTENILTKSNNDYAKFNGKVSFKNVSFTYETRPEVEVLNNICFDIEPGKQTAIVGASGSGKSTIASLLLRFYEPNDGTIYLDDQEYNSFDLSTIRNQMAVVHQEVFLFGGSIFENISYGNPNATFKEVKTAAEKANTMEFIQKFPDGFDTIVGDRGIQLSGGQKQRIAIARAILKDPKILILDEATSSLDSESEKTVQVALDKLMKDRTSIIIAHRLSTIRNADKILVMQDGKIIESGKHEELISKNGVYENLNNLQFSLKSN